MIPCMTAFACALAPQDLPAGSSSLAFESARLDNGVRIHAIELEHATRVAAFSFLPVGLGADPLGRAQFAHLAEHMLIRATDPERLLVGGMAFNGETTGSVLRLESLGPPDDWKELVGRQARWLSARSFDADVLTREKARIEAEEVNTVPRGFNHKWAIAAWSQVVAGAGVVHVHGDVAAATVPQIERYVEDRIRLTDAQVFVGGPVPAQDVLEELRGAFDAVARATSQPMSRPRRPASRPSSRPFVEPGHRDVTWDFGVTQHLEWFPLPDDLTAIEAELVRNVVNQACFQVGTLRRLPGRGSADVVVRDGRRYLLLTATVPVPDDDAGIDVRGAFAEAIENAARLAKTTDPELLATPFRKVPDFAAQRATIGVARIRDLIEANWLMQVGYACARSGLPPAELAAAYRSVDPVRVAKILTDSCSETSRRSATLHPPASDDEER